MAGFKSETATGVKGAFAGVGKIVGTAFAIGGAAEAIKKIGEAAGADQAAFAVLDRTLTNTHQATTLYGKSVEDLIKQQARLKGFSDEDLASSFVRIVSATKDSAKAFKDLGLAEDVARSRHIGVAQAALAISKAEQGVNTALQRLGIVVRPVTANVDRLKAAHDAAAASGAKFTAETQAQYKAALAVAAAQDKAASKTQALAVIQQRFGGSAATFANTAAGSWARLQEQVHLFEVFIADRFLPGFSRAAQAVAGELTRLSHSASVKQAFQTGFNDIKNVVQAVVPPLKAVAQAAIAVDHAVGGQTLLVAAAAYKAVAISVDLAQAASKRWALWQAAATRAQAGGAATTDAETAALAANTAALEANTLALGGAAAAQEALAASTAAATVAEGAQAGVMATLGTGLLSLVGGPIGLATIGVAALAGGIAYLVTRQNAWDAANQATARSLTSLNDAITRGRVLTRSRADQVGRIADDQSAVAQARINLARARDTFAGTTAPRGSLAYKQALLDVRVASQTLASSLRTLGDDQRHLGVITKEQGDTQKDQQEQLKASVKNIGELTTAYRAKLIPAINLYNRSTVGPDAARQSALQAQERVVAGGLAAALDKLGASQKGLAARNTALLAEFTRDVGRLPTKHETRVILDNRSMKTSLTEILTQIFPAAFSQMATSADQAGVLTGQSFLDGLSTSLGGSGKFVPGAANDAISRLLKGLVPSTKAGDAAKKAADKVAADAARANAAAVRAAESAVSAAKQSLSSTAADAKDAIDQARQSLSDAQQSLRDAIVNGQKSITDAVTSAKQNLFSIGSKLASDIQSFLDAQGKQGLGPVTGAAAKQFAKLAALIKAGEGGPDVQRAAQALSTQLQAASAKNAVKAASAKNTIATQINDAIDKFNRGPQSAADIGRLNSGIARILRANKVTFKSLAKEVGTSAAHDLLDEVAAVNAQARASAAGPRRAGSGNAPAIIRPEDAVIDANRQVAAAQRQVSQNQLAEAKTQTTQLKLIHTATKKVAAAIKGEQYQKTLSHNPKPAQKTTGVK